VPPASSTPATHRLIAVRDAYRLAQASPNTVSELSVLDTTDTQAYAVPGRPGRIVVTSGLLRRRDAGQPLGRLPANAVADTMRGTERLSELAQSAYRNHQ